MKPGPSDAYVRMLRGEITTREYIDDLHRRVDEARKATRVDNEVIFAGGFARRLTRWERLMLRMGINIRIRP